MLKLPEAVEKYEIPLLRLISEPPNSPGQYVPYLGLISRNLAPFNRFQGDNTATGVRSLCTAASHVFDKSLFRAIIRILVVNHGLLLDARVQGQDRPFHTAIKSSNLMAVRVFLEMTKTSLSGNTSALISNDPIEKTILLACETLKEKNEEAELNNATEILREIVGFVISNDRPSPQLFKETPCVNVLCKERPENGYEASVELYEAVNNLLKSGFSATIPEKIKNYPLHDACAQGHWKTAASLIQYGADVESFDSDGLTAFDKAKNNDKVSNELRAVLRSAQMNKIIFKK